ncbi:hypothetical protein PC129_g17105 [Phytophthora cactorum]|nr:hypothetical protein PC118_g13514 [Phytophthora cactorum]KAG3062714.1 hypothetical protein PC121_g12471 [Phytophthora cactorum]KAG3081558.1 hypothetical protein PC122_g11278 [Phytophthora cactorum]KAG3211926.1 hypothetical protein PC129_g17105 [Phytophthora cactorum]KAG4234713.1 hypothetical protein PC116_g17132 [Phytophthora cactorum]
MVVKTTGCVSVAHIPEIESVHEVESDYPSVLVNGSGLVAAIYHASVAEIDFVLVVVVQYAQGHVEASGCVLFHMVLVLGL